jgi:hypothetical protein
MRFGVSIFVIALAAWLVLMPANALAWGPEGHRVVAHLAFERLTPKAKADVAALIARSADQATPSCPVASLEDASTWPDCVRPLHARFDYLAVMHYEDVPVCSVAPKARYCPGGKCITDETRRAIAILRDTKRPAVERLQALEEVAHFIGDMHQPLHAADNGDRGGNEDHVQVAGHASNLHHVWDTEILENAVGTSEVDAEAALRPIIAANASHWSSGDVDTWLAESHRLAMSYVYAKLTQPPACGLPAPAQEISRVYLEWAAPLVRVQLARAAVRLALVLNGALR